MMLANALRGTGVIIAVLGLLDPAVTLPWNAPPRVAIREADTADGAPGAMDTQDTPNTQNTRVGENTRNTQGGPDSRDVRDVRDLRNARTGRDTASDAASEATSEAASMRALTQRVRERFAREFAIVDASDRATRVDATVVIGGADARLPIDLDVEPGTAPGTAPSAARGAAFGADSTRVTGTLVGVMPGAVSARDAAGVVRITDVIASRTAHLSGRVRIEVALDARGLRGRTSLVEIQSEGLTLGRATQAWTKDADHARVALDVTPIREGLARFNVTVTAAAPVAQGAASSAATGAAGTTDAAAGTAGNAATDSAAAAETKAAGTTATASQNGGATGTVPTNAAASVDGTPAGATATGTTSAAAGSAGTPPLARADVGVRITNHPLRILFVEPRPSWTTRFIRLALAGDARFRIDAQSQVSRGLAARTTDAPVRLTAEALAPFDAVVVGAADQLGAADVEALRAFARLRGGLIVFAPDRLPQGPYVDLIPAEGFEERLLETPQLVSAATATAAGGDAPGANDATEGDALGAELASLPLLASELALPRALRPGAITLAQVSLQAGAAARPLVIASPLGDGQVLFAGAMDAWRFRDRPQPRFDAFWRQLLFALGAQAPPPVTLTIDPQIARPGEPVTLLARWRRDRVASQASSDGTMTVRATLAPASAATPEALAAAADDAGPVRPNAAAPDSVGPDRVGSDRAAFASVAAGASPIRLWPADRPGEFRATLNAPAGAGVYAMSLDAESPTPPVRAPLLVSSDVRRPERSWEAFRARIEARGGLVVTDADLDQAVDHLQRQARGSSSREPVHPWRSAWWILPFAGCLGGEWLLRRRRGDA